MQTKILIADNLAIVRQGLRSLLETQPDLHVVGEASDGNEALALVGELQPDLLITEAVLPQVNGIYMARIIRQRELPVHVMLLSMYANEAYVIEALKNGAEAYVLKSEGIAALLQAIHDVLGGRRYLSASLSERAIQVYIDKAAAKSNQAHPELTKREYEILDLAAQGCTNAATAVRLSISPRTVETHRNNIMKKLDLHSQSDLVRYALVNGILPSGE